MGLNQQKGFTLTEMAVSVAVLSVLTAISIPGYNVYIARQQAAESVVLMDTLKPKTLQNLVKLGKCTESGSTETIVGKYGNLVLSGTASKTAILDNQVLLKTGCTYTYTLKANTGRFISGKTIVADLFNNGSLSKSTLSKVDDLYIPKSLITLIEGNKSLISGDTPVTTPINPVPQLDPIIDSTLIIDKDYRGTNFSDDGYYVKNAVNVYDFAVEKLGRAPMDGEEITVIVDTDVAVVGYTGVLPINTAEGDGNFWGDDGRTATGALMFDNRWNNVGSLTLNVKGAAIGRGGQGAVWYNASSWYGQPGAPALSNTSSLNIAVENSGVISVGGGGGGAEKGTSIGGPGAPYGRRLVSGCCIHVAATFATLKTPGTGEKYYPYGWGGVFWLGGVGGTWGAPGLNSTGTAYTYAPGTSFMSIPHGGVGNYKIGSFTVKNVNSGYTKGS